MRWESALKISSVRWFLSQRGDKRATQMTTRTSHLAATEERLKKLEERLDTIKWDNVGRTIVIIIMGLAYFVTMYSFAASLNLHADRMEAFERRVNELNDRVSSTDMYVLRHAQALLWHERRLDEPVYSGNPCEFNVPMSFSAGDAPEENQTESTQE